MGSSSFDGKNFVDNIYAMFGNGALSAEITTKSERLRYAGFNSCSASHQITNYLMWMGKQTIASPTSYNERIELSDRLILAAVEVGMLSDVHGVPLSSPNHSSMQYSLKFAQRLRDPSSHLGSVGGE